MKENMRKRERERNKEKERKRERRRELEKCGESVEERKRTKMT